VAVDLFAKAVAQTREPLRSHPQREILTFNVAGRNVSRQATLYLASYSYYLCRRIAWLQLMIMGFQVAYGPKEQITVNKEAAN